jgi:hypothetical protein
MKVIRDFIPEVRQIEHQPDSELMLRTRNLLEARTPDRVSDMFLKKKDLLFSHSRGFADLCDSPPDDYSAVWLYTSNEGYEALFVWAKNIFRSTRAAQDEIKLAVFIVELVNIDLFNYWYRNPETAAFQGWMYRGMSMGKPDFDTLADGGDSEDIWKRYRSVPLALDSCTTDRGKAESFINPMTDEVPVLLSIRAISLSDSSLGFYNSRYPESVVSPICTTSLEQLSRFPENEILLRGGFYHILDIRHSRKRVDRKPLRVVEVATMNANRDHPTTPQGPNGDGPRDLFRTLVEAERDLYCYRYYTDRHRNDDANHYAESLERRETNFRKSYDNTTPPWL